MSERVDDGDEVSVKELPKNKPPAAAMQDTLASIQVTLAKLVRQDQKDKDLGMLMADCRDVMTEAVGMLHTQLTDVLALLDRLLQGSTAVPTKPGRIRPWYWGASGAVVGLLLGASLWWMASSRGARYEALAGALDGVLVQQYGVLPKGTQEALNAIYVQGHFQPPGQRVKGGK